MKPSVVIVGAGSMGQILAEGLLRAGWETDTVHLVARREERAAEVERLTGISTTLDAAAAVIGKEVVVLTVKPKDVAATCKSIRESLTSDQVVLSVAAGVPLSVYRTLLPDVAIVRAMPNTPAAVDEGMSAFCAEADTSSDALKLVEAVLGAVGETIYLSEDLMDAVTAISGSGPAYVFLLAEALTEAAIREGLPHHAAEKLVLQTIRGAGLLAHTSDKSAFRLRAEVTSPGGTTSAALHVLENSGFRTSIEDAVRAAAQRSHELGVAAAELIDND
ncbi:MAG: pyrroline-5-carboxylate reductase [Acidobacteria bacterium]|nr:pyrroline-5-carboxylate reductase [Acidobacteriota bacterium]